MTELHDTHAGLHTHEHPDQDCHENKSILGYSLLPAVAFEFLPIVYKINYEVVFDLENNIATPFLEPDRKPPRV